MQIIQGVKCYFINIAFFVQTICGYSNSFVYVDRIICIAAVVENSLQFPASDTVVNLGNKNTDIKIFFLSIISNANCLLAYLLGFQSSYKSYLFSLQHKVLEQKLIVDSMKLNQQAKLHGFLP